MALNLLLEVAHTALSTPAVLLPLFDVTRFTAKALAERGIVDSGQFIPQNTVNVGVIGSTNDMISVNPLQSFHPAVFACFLSFYNTCL